MFSRRDRFWLCASVVLQLALLYGQASARFETVHQRTFDLALYARIAFGLAHGDVSSRVLDSYPLGTHLSAVLLPLGLLGRLLPIVHVLLFCQALCIALCVFPIARIGARHMGRSGIFLGVAAWWLYPNLFHVASYEFHPGTLAVLPMCWAFDALERGQLRDLTLCCVGILLCREDFGLMCSIFALMAYARFGRRSALTLAGACFVYTGLATLVVLQHAPPHGSAAQHFGIWGGSPLGIVSSLFHDPARVVAHFREPSRLLYLPRLLAVLSFFPLRAAWLLLPAAPYLALNLISAFPTTCQQFSHYLTPAVPALVISGLVGVTAVRKRALRNLWLVTLCLGHYALGGSPVAHDFDAKAFRRDAQTLAAQQILAQIPARRSVQAPDPLLPHLAERTTLRRAPPPEADTDFVVVDISHRARFAGREDLLRTTEEPIIRRLAARADYALLALVPPYALFERGRDPRDTPSAAACLDAHGPTQTEATALTPCLSVLGAELSGKTLTFELRANGPCREDLALRFGPEAAPWRVELICDGRLWPNHLRAGDRLRSTYVLKPSELASARSGTLWLGTLSADGKAVASNDPLAVPVRVHQHARP